MKLSITMIMFVLGISISSAQLDLGNISTTVFRQVDWAGNNVWKDNYGAIILKERKYQLISGTKTVRIVSGLNPRKTSSINNSRRYVLNPHGHVIVLGSHGKILGKYVDGPAESLIFQYNPRSPNKNSDEKRYTSIRI